MKNSESLKTLVREKYGEIATTASEAKGCGCGCSTAVEYSMIGDEYDQVTGYVPDADLRLGCGIPTEVARIEPGHTVLDLGSGAGLDVFAARALVGEKGRVIGLDMTPEMIDRARENADKLGFTNVTFIQGDIESMPIKADTIDVIVSNCVLNLVPDKKKAFEEIHRVLKPGGHFCVSDIVIDGHLPESIQKAAELYTGCVSGAMNKPAYLDIIRTAGFASVEVLKQRAIPVPEEELQKHLTEEEIASFQASEHDILSVTVFGVKPA